MARDETIRRLRLGDVKRVLRSRYGVVLPDDDVGRADLIELLILSADKNFANVIEVWAPWLATIDAEFGHGPCRQHARLSAPTIAGSSRPAGLRLTHDERERLGTWQIAACDVTAEERIELRKAKERARSWARRRKQGVSREEYIAAHTKRKPWVGEGISRRTWYNRRKAKAVASVSGERIGVALGMSGEQKPQ